MFVVRGFERLVFACGQGGGSIAVSKMTRGGLRVDKVLVLEGGGRRETKIHQVPGM